MIEIHVFVTGVVQGVGFRSAVKKQALLHGIRGYARNLPDGRVEICAQGQEEQIAAFLKGIEEKPGLGSISHVEKKVRSLQKSFAAFEIF